MIPRLELRNICKRYPGVVANDDISLAIMPGEIHAVLGENGAGKSTLMKIIYGAVQADSGEIFCDGSPIESHNPAVSRALGIEMVYQHFALFESVSVVENIALSMNTPFDLAALSRQVLELSRQLRHADRPGAAGPRSFGRRAPARRDRALPAAGPQAADPRRADLGADAAGRRQAVRDAAAAGRRWLQHPLHQPQAGRGAAALRHARPCCATAV